VLRLLDLSMYRKFLLIVALATADLFAGLKVSADDLVYKDRLWFYKDSNAPFTGIAFKTSKESGTIIQQARYIDGLAWGKYYEW